MRLFSAATPEQRAILDRPYYDSAHAAVLLSLTGVKFADNVISYGLAGRLYLSKSGWLLLQVPNAIGRGAFDALYEQGVELPTRDTNDPNEVFNAHISVMSKKEVDSIGIDKITERGHTFRYTLGPVKEITPTTWEGVSRVWAIEVYSPELKNLRKSYGLSPLPGPNGDYQYHITFAIRRTNALRQAKAASGIDPSYSPEHAEECCPKCGARLEQNTYDEKCNRCGGEWLKGESAATSGLKAAAFDAEKLKALRKRRGECPGCGKPFKEDEPYPDVEMCEVCERYGKPKTAGKKVTPVKTQKRVREDEIEICPHCDEEIREKSVYMDPENYLYHRPCMDKGPIKHITPLSKDELYERLGWTKDAGINEDIDAAAAECEEPKSKEQAEAGNYRHGHCRLHGMGITIETGRGMTRKGTDKNGKPWSITMAHHYGYIKRTISEADEDHVDVFIGPDAESELVFVVDQYIDDHFDESKCMLGFKSKDAAKEGYLACYDKNWKGLGAITAATISQFKDWVFNGDTGKPFNTHARKTWQEKAAGVPSLAANEGAMPQSSQQAVLAVRGSGNQSMSKVVSQLPSVLQRSGTATSRGVTGATQEQPGIFSSELLLGDVPYAITKQAQQPQIHLPGSNDGVGGLGGGNRHQQMDLATTSPNVRMVDRTSPHDPGRVKVSTAYLRDRLPVTVCAPDFQKIASPIATMVNRATIRRLLLGAADRNW